MLTFPLTNFQQKVIGVVQLINRYSGRKKEPVVFNDKQADLKFRSIILSATSYNTLIFLNKLTKKIST